MLRDNKSNNHCEDINGYVEMDHVGFKEVSEWVRLKITSLSQIILEDFDYYWN